MRYVSKLVDLGYNPLYLDTDFTVQDNFYKYLRSPLMAPHSLLFMREGEVRPYPSSPSALRPDMFCPFSGRREEIVDMFKEETRIHLLHANSGSSRCSSPATLLRLLLLQRLGQICAPRSRQLSVAANVTRLHGSSPRRGCHL